MHIARGIVDQERAWFAAILGSLEDLAAAGLDANATGLGAGTPGPEASHFTVDGASVYIAFTGRGHARRASLATVEGGSDDSARTSLRASAATGRAGTPRCVGADDAVNGTAVGVAALGLLFVRASLATVAMTNNHTARTLLRTILATTLGASAPGAKFTHLAIDSAEVVVASLGLSESYAATSVGSSSGDAARTGGGASATSLGANAPGRPFRDDTVGRAGLSVAVASGLQSGARLAAELGCHNSTASASLLASSATL